MDLAGVIGADNALPWHLPVDLKHFKESTLGKPVVMGRKTFESIGRPLPKRTNIVLTRQMDFHAEGIRIAQDTDTVLRIVKTADEVMIIGGAQVYGLFLPLADRLLITRVHTHVHGDAFFPTFDARDWTLHELRHAPADNKNPHACTFEEFRRKQ